MQISTSWKDNYEGFPMGQAAPSGSRQRRPRDQNKSTVVSARFQIESFQVRKVRDKIDFGSNPMLDVQQPLYMLVIRGF